MRIAIDAITVGVRRRESLGDLDALAASIAAHGLIHPVVVDDAGNLVAGERRLRAAMLLGWTEIDARSLGDLTLDEREQIEWEENLRRKDFTPYEAAKMRTLEAAAHRKGLERKAEEERQRQEAERKANNGQSTTQNGGRRGRPGQPTNPSGRRSTATAMGKSPATLRNAEQHVAIAERFPVMQARGWTQKDVLAAGVALKPMSDEEAHAAVAMVTTPGYSVPFAVETLGYLAAMEAEERAEIFRLFASPDERFRSLAITRAGRRPPMPDKREADVTEAIRHLTAANRYPDDPLAPRILELRAALIDLRDRIRERSREHAQQAGRTVQEPAHP